MFMLHVLGFFAFAADAAETVPGPCDIYEAAGTGCVAAHSTVRALYSNYSGPLYSVWRSTDGATIDIGVRSRGGFANSALQEQFCGSYDQIAYAKLSTGQVCESSAQIPTYCGQCGPKWGDFVKCQAMCNAFPSCTHITYFEDEGCRIYSACANPTPTSGVMTDIFQRSGTVCSIRAIYDQSPMGNHIYPAPPGGAAELQDAGVNAARDPIRVGGNAVFGAYFEGGMGYRRDNTTGIATGDEPQSIYMVVSGTHYNDQCCFDYGNAETNNNDDGASTMEAVYFGSSTGWGHGSGDGPWVMADIENCLSAGSSEGCSDKQPANTPVVASYVTAVLKGGSGNYTIKGGDASGRLATMYSGPRPRGYNPMHKQGAIILGIGGDNSDNAVGTFYEGAMTRGYASDATDESVQANIASAGYGKWGS